MSVTGYLELLTRRVMCVDRSQCYYNVNNLNFCLWTNGSLLTRHEAQTACEQRNNSFLPRITNGDIQSKLRDFRNAASEWYLLRDSGFWMDIYAAATITSFHWIDGSSLAG